MYIVYRITSPTGTMYIGLTKRLHGRVMDHKSKSHIDAINEDIDRYGFDNFSVSILGLASSKGDGMAIENTMIDYYGHRNICSNKTKNKKGVSDNPVNLITDMKNLIRFLGQQPEGTIDLIIRLLKSVNEGKQVAYAKELKPPVKRWLDSNRMKYNYNDVLEKWVINISDKGYNFDEKAYELAQKN